jgi:hypothetical protein
MHQHYYGELTPEQHVDPRWDLENATNWDGFFRQRRLFELSRYEGNGSSPANNNASAIPPGRRSRRQRRRSG